ncbi:MAG: hypothetical protein IJU03_09845 [Thermoguttaceae bacterium]|nr:hypothetical protein [Thermoguttaceae bacterium]
MCAKSKEDKEAKAAAKAAAKEEKAKAKAKTKKKNAAPPSEYGPFLLYGQYMLIAVAVVLFVALVALGGGLQKFTLTPEQINSSSQSAEENIKNSKVTPKEFDEAVVVYPYEAYAELIKTSVKVNAYETPVRWEQSLFPDKNKRPDVKPLPLENLRAQACIGAIMYNEPSASANANSAMGGGMMGGGGMAGGGMAGGGMSGGGMGMGMGGELKGRQWITITGSIPIRRQQSIYSDLYSDAQYMDDARDQPRYIFYELQRGTVGAGGAVDWQKVDVIRAIKKENNLWAGSGSDQVGYNYQAPIVQNFPPMAMSCPPMANKPFGEEVANLPNIPLNSTEQIAVQADDMKEWNKLQEEMQQMDESTLLDRDPFSDVRGGVGGGGMGFGMMGGMDSMGAGMASSGGMGGMGGSSMEGGAGNNSWLVNQNAITRSRMKVQQSVSVDYYLFRYFDFEVEPEKTYMYRVKLILANPNYGVKEEFVENPESTENKYVESDFSAPSNPVALGADARVFAEKVEAPTKPGVEPRITLSSVYFDADSASESLLSGQTLKRGAVANFMNQSHNPVNVQGGMSGDMMNEMYYGGSSSKKGKGKSGKKTVNHISDITVVDALGGVKLPDSELTSPAKIMILEPNGLLEIREIKEDARELSRYDGSNDMMGMGGGMMGSGGLM